MCDDERDDSPTKDLPTSQSTSYVYPIKSLLTGIQPAPDNQRLSLSSLSSTGSSSSPELTRWIAEEVERARMYRLPYRLLATYLLCPDDTNIESVNTACDPNTPSSTPPISCVRAQRSQSVAAPSARPHKTKRHSKSNRKSYPVVDTIPNFRHFPAEDMSPRSFSRNPSMFSPVEPTSPTLSVSLEEASPHFNPRHPPPLPIVSQDAFTATSHSLLPETAPPDPPQTAPPDPPEIPAAIPSPSDPELPFNTAELGLVHLAPAEISKPPSSASGASSEHYYTPEASLLAANQLADGATANDDEDNLQMNSRSASGSPSNSDSGSSESLSETSDDGQLLTVRFQAVQDEHGHHVVVGREGLLTKCEDEVRIIKD